MNVSLLLSIFIATALSIAELRVSTLEGIDHMLAGIYKPGSVAYQLDSSIAPRTFHNTNPALVAFEQQHGYFTTHPLVGRVSSREQDIALTQDLLATIAQMQNPQERLLATAEVVSKVLAYRDLKEGMEIAIPLIANQEVAPLISYRVDRVFDLWHGMPAFGLLPKQIGAAPALLLFRGTDLEIGSVRGWASVVSDFDRRGVGFTAFENARSSLHDWLEKAMQRGIKAQVLGFSLGGTLAAYALLFESAFVNTTMPSFAFNPAGILNPPEQMNIKVYVNLGDLVSKDGLLFGDVEQISLQHPLAPLHAHTTLMTAQPEYSLSEVDVAKENQARHNK